MEEVLDFVTENSFWVIVLLIYLFNALFGKKKPEKGKAEKGKPAAAPDRKPIAGASASTDRRNSVREMIAEAERKMQQTIREVEGVSDRSAPPVAAAPAPAESRAPETIDPYGFHPVDTRMTLEREADDARASAYAYHNTIEKPEEQEYHLTGFDTFRSAHGFSAANRTSASKQEQAAPAEESWIYKALSNPDDVRHALILKELLDKPKALR